MEESRLPKPALPCREFRKGKRGDAGRAEKEDRTGGSSLDNLSKAVEVNGIKLLCFESVGSDTHEHFLPPWEEDKSGSAKFFEIS